MTEVLPVCRRSINIPDVIEKPERELHKAEFLNHIREAFRHDERIDPEQVMRAVFRLLSRRVSVGEISDIKQLLPAALRHLWPATT